jgi:hypothetical protein
MATLRPAFALALLAVALVGSALMPAVHWASHGLHGHDGPHAEHMDGRPLASSDSDAGETGECPDCAHLQTAKIAGPAAEPFYAGVVGLARSLPAPEAPSASADLATPDSRGPPSRA